MADESLAIEQCQRALLFFCSVTNVTDVPQFLNSSLPVGRQACLSADRDSSKYLGAPLASCRRSQAPPAERLGAGCSRAPLALPACLSTDRSDDRQAALGRPGTCLPVCPPDRLAVLHVPVGTCLPVCPPDRLAVSQEQACLRALAKAPCLSATAAWRPGRPVCRQAGLSADQAGPLPPPGADILLTCTASSL
ncbi:MAG: hypothetical protein KatS3mg029_0865 [Saprospiraceae bacterium]|nr:MAG: hypothetical protein KatS3mg029_0865 [Saprospiraceae bacterium]